MTKLIIIRHGESEANQAGVVAGHSDYKLSSLGLEQAEQTAAHLAGEQIDAVYSSDLVRAVETARPHAERRGLSVKTCPELRETYCGRWEGVTFDSLRKNEAELFESFRKHYMFFTMPEGEELWESGQRFYQKTLEIAQAHPDQTVLLVAHGAVIRVFWAMVSQTPREQADEKHPYPSNASYSVAYCDGERITPGEFSHDAHLPCATHLHI